MDRFFILRFFHPFQAETMYGNGTAELKKQIPRSNPKRKSNLHQLVNFCDAF